MEVGKKHNIRVTSIQPGMVATELAERTTDPVVRQAMQDSGIGIRIIDPSEIADAVLFAAQAPDHVNLAELFIIPTD